MGIDTLQELRDVTIVAFTIAGTVFFLIGLFVMFILGVVAIRLMGALRGAVENGIGPMFSSFRETADNVRGTTAFISETAVSPVMRIYSIYRGAKRVLSVLTGLGRRRHGQAGG